MATYTVVKNVRSPRELENTLLHMGVSGSIVGRASTSNEVDDFLEHFGVKGMKWGRRKSSYNDPPSGVRYTGRPTASGSVSGTKTSPTRAVQRSNAGQSNAAKYLEKHGGSEKKAIAAAAGRTVAINYLANRLAIGVSRASPNHPNVQAGAKIAAAAIGLANTAYGAKQIHDVHKVASKGKKK